MRYVRSILQQGVFHPRRTVIVALLLSLLAAAMIVDWEHRSLDLHIDPTLDRLLPDDEPAQAAFERLSLTFGAPDQLIVGLEMAQVFSPEGLRAVALATRQVRAIPGVRDVASLATVPNLLADDEALDVSSFTRQAEVDPGSIDLMARQVANNPLYAGSLVTDDGQMAALIITLQGVDARQYLAADLDARLRDAAAVPGVTRVRLTGASAIQAATTDALLGTLILILPLLVALLLALLWLAFRSLRATVAAASDPLTATKPDGPTATASSSRTSDDSTAAPVPDIGTSTASMPACCSRRTSPLPSPSESTASTSTSPRRGSASPTSSGQPITHAVASSGRAKASSPAVASPSISSTACQASRCPSGEVSTRAQSHQSGAEVGWRSTIRRQAATSPEGSSRKAARAWAVSATSTAWSAPDARATYRSRSMGCT